MDLIKNFSIFIIPIAVGLIIQAIKFTIFSIKHGWDIRYALTHGHMPSAHTGFIISLITSVGIYEGTRSGAFAVAIALGIIVIDDAVRLRMILGDQGRYLNMLIQQLNVSEKQFPRLKERVGHRISEVLIGGLLGFILTVFFALLLARI